MPSTLGSCGLRGWGAEWKVYQKSPKNLLVELRGLKFKCQYQEIQENWNLLSLEKLNLGFGFGWAWLRGGLGWVEILGWDTSLELHDDLPKRFLNMLKSSNTGIGIGKYFRALVGHFFEGFDACRCNSISQKYPKVVYKSHQSTESAKLFDPPWTSRDSTPNTPMSPFWTKGAHTWWLALRLVESLGPQL